MSKVKRFVRGEAGMKALGAGLDELGVAQGDAFLVSKAQDPPLARSSDPETSKTAAELLSSKQRRTVFDEYQRVGDGGLAAFEAVTLTGIRDGWKRVSDLVGGGLLEEIAGLKRTNPETKREGQVFRVSEAGRVARAEFAREADATQEGADAIDQAARLGDEPESFDPASPGTSTTPFDPYS